MDYKKLGDTDSLVNKLRLLAKPALLVLIFCHFFILSIVNIHLPPFLQSFGQYYLWYPRLTGQVQFWELFRFPLREDDRFEVKSTFADGSTDFPLGEQK